MSLFANTESQFQALLAKAPRNPPRSVAEQEADHRAFDLFLKDAREQRAREARSAEMRQHLVEALSFRLDQEASEKQAAFLELSEETKQRYLRDIERFKKWCIKEGVSYLPAESHVVGTFLLECCSNDESNSTVNAATSRRMKSALQYWHVLNDYPDPTEDVLVSTVMRWIRHDPWTVDTNIKDQDNG